MLALRLKEAAPSLVPGFIFRFISARAVLPEDVHTDHADFAFNNY
jgi:hypothetical protein